MVALVRFFDIARKSFKKSNLPGEFLGVTVEGDNSNQKCFFLHKEQNNTLRTEWIDAGGCWGEVFKAIRKEYG